MKLPYCHISNGDYFECIGKRGYVRQCLHRDRETVVRIAVILVISFLSIASTEALSYAASTPRDAEREAAIVAELQKQAPEAVADFKAATVAFDNEDLETATAGYRRVLERAPNFDAAHRRLGYALVEQGKTAEGIASAERALAIRKTPENLSNLAQCLAFPSPTSKPTPVVLGRAASLVGEAVMLAPTDSHCLLLKAMIAIQLGDQATFESSVERLRRAAPDLMMTHYYSAIVAATHEQWLTADREIREAGRLGLPSETVQAFLATGVGFQARLWFWGMVVGAASCAWILGLAVMFLVGKMLSMMTLASIERDDPNQTVSTSVRRLRAIYRRIVTLSGMYWYISLPFVAVIVVAVTAAIIYAFLAVGRIPVKLTIVLVLGAVMSLYAIVRSLFVRVDDSEDPGRAITESDAPELWKTVREVAAMVGTRPVDEIWLTPGTDLAVFERGSMRQKMADRGRRALLLGAGVLEGFEQGDFFAVLAHEYGHFSHRDTAGGDVALRVRNGMMAFAIALAKAGFAVWWNLAFQFLRLYDFLFRRISHGATRLQEVLADRVAIQHYGLDAFRNGLTHVIRRSILFRKLASDELQNAIDQQRVVSNLYSLSPPSDPAVLSNLEEEVTKAIQAETTEDDTHPSPKDRFRLGERIHSARNGRIHGCVWQLFSDPSAMMAEMTALVAMRVGADSAPGS